MLKKSGNKPAAQTAPNKHTQQAVPGIGIEIQLAVVDQTNYLPLPAYVLKGVVVPLLNKVAVVYTAGYWPGIIPGITGAA